MRAILSAYGSEAVEASKTWGWAAVVGAAEEATGAVRLGKGGVWGLGCLGRAGRVGVWVWRGVLSTSFQAWGWGMGECRPARGRE